jgi:hypothetical protein
MGYEVIVSSKASLSFSLDFTSPSLTVPSIPSVSLWQVATVAHLLLSWKRRFLKERTKLPEPNVPCEVQLPADEEAQMAEVFDPYPKSYSYRKCALIGTGSCSKVYRAVKVKSVIENPALLQCANEVFALKELICPESKEYYRKVFIHEARVMKTLDHENCVRFHEAIWEVGQDKAWIVMEHADCGDLTDLISHVKLREDHMATFCKEVSVDQDVRQPEIVYSRIVARMIIDQDRLLKDSSISTARTSCIEI